MEINSSWYMFAHINTYGLETNKYFAFFGEFINDMFDLRRKDHPMWLRFAPGAQYIVPKKNILFYSKNFYKRILGYVNYQS